MFFFWIILFQLSSALQLKLVIELKMVNFPLYHYFCRYPFSPPPHGFPADSQNVEMGLQILKFKHLCWSTFNAIPFSFKSRSSVDLVFSKASKVESICNFFRFKRSIPFRRTWISVWSDIMAWSRHSSYPGRSLRLSNRLSANCIKNCKNHNWGLDQSIKFYGSSLWVPEGQELST